MTCAWAHAIIPLGSLQRKEEVGESLLHCQPQWLLHCQQSCESHPALYKALALGSHCTTPVWATLPISAGPCLQAVHVDCGLGTRLV